MGTCSSASPSGFVVADDEVASAVSAVSAALAVADVDIGVVEEDVVTNAVHFHGFHFYTEEADVEIAYGGG